VHDLSICYPNFVPLFFDQYHFPTSLHAEAANNGRR